LTDGELLETSSSAAPPLSGRDVKRGEELAQGEGADSWKKLPDAGRSARLAEDYVCAVKSEGNCVPETGKGDLVGELKS